MIEVCPCCGGWEADDPEELDYFDDIEFVLCHSCLFDSFDPFYFDNVEFLNHLYSNPEDFDYIIQDILHGVPS